MSPSAADEDGESPSGRGAEAAYCAVGAAVGVLVGLVGSAFHFGVDRLLAWPGLLGRAFEGVGPAYLLASGLTAAIMVLVSVWMVRRFAPEASGSGVQEVEGAMAGLRTVRWLPVLLVKFFGGLLSLGSGLVVGREGPTIHIGASVSEAFAQALRMPSRDARGLLAAGAAAGLAAAFSAPLASILFVIEETRRQFPYSLKTYTAVMLASVASAVVTEAIAGPRAFMALSVPDVPLVWLPAFLVLGILLGGFGVLFNRALVWSLDAAAALGRRSSFYVLPALVGFAIGVLLLVAPDATMGGEGLAVRMVGEKLPLTIVALIVVLRFVMTMASYATGVPGGIFAPILSLATAFGLSFGLLLLGLLPLPPGAEAAFAVAAMGGLFTATVRAPLVGVVLVAELTGAYSILVPAILTCLSANLVAAWLGGRPIYQVLLERTLARAGMPLPTGRKTLDGSPQIGGWDQR